MSCREFSRLREHDIKHNDIPFLSRIVRFNTLTHWGRVTHICVVKLTIIGSDNCLTPGRRQAIIWTNAGIMLIGPLEQTSILIGIQTFSFKKMHLEDVVREVVSILSRPQCVKNALRWTRLLCVIIMKTYNPTWLNSDFNYMASLLGTEAATRYAVHNDYPLRTDRCYVKYIFAFQKGPLLLIYIY